ncbi:sodium channel protein Nach [Episyrphus balteatus]|uniref:sodium channel protein Nach n=1 Tax=Episyrphus balteatus TaxID=286459 RepID=UPI0024860CAB|nr:sodium channel protein Nach [Episyrphus balteatus]
MTTSRKHHHRATLRKVKIVKQSSWRQRMRLALRDTFFEYTKVTRVNGIWMLRKNRTKGLMRFMWSGLLLGLLCLGTYLSFQLWLKFYSYPILNTIGTDLSITDVAFPGITVCSPKVVNFEKVQQYVRKLILPDNIEVQDVLAGFDFLNAFTDQNWIPNNASFAATDSVLAFNNISIYEAALEVSAGCEDFFQHCFWGGKEFPCKQEHDYLSFVPSTSYLGPCCSFNYNPRNESYVPFAANIFGMDGGLSFIGKEGSETNLSTGLIVLVHHPMDYTTETAASVTINSKYESFVEIMPTYQSSSLEVLELTKTKRDCLTSSDVSLKTYRQAACLVACQVEEILKTCGCHSYHLPTAHTETHNECKLKDAACYAANFDNFKSLKCEHCLPNCFDVTYKTSAYNTDLRQHNFSISSLYRNDEVSEGSFIGRVYMAKQAVPSVRKVTVMSWISLLSDLGGVFNLCLGLSIISLVEFLYFFTYVFYKNYRLHGVLMKN